MVLVVSSNHNNSMILYLVIVRLEQMEAEQIQAKKTLRFPMTVNSDLGVSCGVLSRSECSEM